MFHLEEITHKLLKHPYFAKAKQVKEMNPGHPEDSVYTHLVQTADFITAHKDGAFIANTDARKLFQDFMNRKIEGVLYSDIAILTGLVHDIGKILSYKEEEKIFSSNQVSPNTGFTYNPHHGYYGSVIVKPLLKEVGLHEKIVDYITDIVRFHLVPFDYYKGTAGYAIKDAIDDLKPRMEGRHIEVCINAYGDIAQHKPLQECFELIGRMFEEPHFYSTREYVVA